MDLDPYTGTPAEIADIVERVEEDFAPFDVEVVTYCWQCEWYPYSEGFVLPAGLRVAVGGYFTDLAGPSSSGRDGLASPARPSGIPWCRGRHRADDRTAF